MEPTIQSILSDPDVLTGLVVAAVATIVVWLATRRWPERATILAAFVVKLGACFAMCAMTMPVFAGGDMIGYHHHGLLYAELLRGDLLDGTSEYLAKTPFFLPVGINVERCRSLSGLAHFLVFDSYIGSSVVFAAIGFAGQLLLYRTFVCSFPDPRLALWWRAGILFMPGLTFWSSGLLKDPLGIGGLGCATWGLHRFLARGRLTDLLWIALGVYTLALFRAQIIPVILFAAVPLLLGSPALAQVRRRRPSRLAQAVLRVALAAAALGALNWVATFDRRVSTSNIMEQVLEERAKYLLVHGGSTILDAREDLREVVSSPLAVVLMWPRVVMFTLFRPSLWEGFVSPIILAAALENTVLLALAARAALRAVLRPRAAVAALKTPFFWTCVIFVSIFSYAVGLSTPNLGTVSRYRIPVLPFFLGMLTIFEGRYLEARGRSRRAPGKGCAGQGPPITLVATGEVSAMEPTRSSSG